MKSDRDQSPWFAQVALKFLDTLPKIHPALGALMVSWVMFLSGVWLLFILGLLSGIIDPGAIMKLTKWLLELFDARR